MLKAIIFDFDDTLVMTRTIVTQALIQTAKTYYNLIITKTEIDSLWNIPFTEFMRQLFQNCDDIESIIANYKTIRKLFSNKVYPDTISTLDTLRKGYKLGILSATTKELVLNDINACGIG